MRLADAELVPYQFTACGETVGRYVKEVEKLLQEKQDTVRERNRQLDEGVFPATADPRVPSVAPSREELPPYLSFAPLDNAVDGLNRAAERYERAFAKAQANGGAIERSEEHTSELQSPCNLVCRLLLEKKKKKTSNRSNVSQ